eukprot:s4600_g16.t1
MGGCKYVDEGLETSGWNFRVDVTHLSNEGVTSSDVDGGGKLWSFVNGNLVYGRWRESVAWCDEVVTGESVCDDEKVSEGDGGEVTGFEEQISWPQHTVVALETVEMVQKEWNGEPEGVEDVME